MGPDGDHTTVVDSSSRLHGYDDVYVADASVMPTIPRANTHLTVLAITERIAEQLERRYQPLNRSG